jgi:hypothetical protein
MVIGYNQFCKRALYFSWKGRGEINNTVLWNQYLSPKPNSVYLKNGLPHSGAGYELWVLLISTASLQEEEEDIVNVLWSTPRTVISVVRLWLALRHYTCIYNKWTSSHIR